MPLTETTAKNAKPKDKAYKLADEKGLYLLVMKSGKYWRFDYRFDGKRKTMALGVYPTVTLNEARKTLAEARNLLNRGIDPSGRQKMERQSQAIPKPAGFLFNLADNGALLIETKTAKLRLTPTQTTALRAFLDASKAEPLEGDSPC